jgi:hypothetical protein
MENLVPAKSGSINSNQVNEKRSNGAPGGAPLLNLDDRYREAQ